MLARERQPGQNDSTTMDSQVEREEARSARIETRGFLQTEKIARIREQILQGTYHVSAAELAKAILRSGASRLLPKKKTK